MFNDKKNFEVNYFVVGIFTFFVATFFKLLISINMDFYVINLTSFQFFIAVLILYALIVKASIIRFIYHLILKALLGVEYDKQEEKQEYFVTYIEKTFVQDICITNCVLII
jgi:hypothetical protein